MAPPDPPIAEAHVAIGIMPTFFAENPRQWFQTAEAQFATARPAPNNGQKYFHLLQKLPAEIMNNCSDFIYNSRYGSYIFFHDTFRIFIKRV
jgi:hypothetical protein